MRVKRELLAHLLEYGYLAEKATGVLIVIGFIVLLIVLPAWPVTVINYIRNPVVYGLTSLGNAILYTSLIIASGLTAYLLPHFAPLLKPHSFKEVKDRRTRILYLSITAIILSITVLVYFLFALTLIF